jgi:ribosomal protein L11 methyltransferase
VRNSPLWRISVATSGEAEEAVAELLTALFGQPASIYTDAETGESTVTVFSDKSSVRSASRPAELRQRLRQIRGCGLEIGPASIAWRKIRREDWAESWKRHFQPVEIGRLLLIKPSWSRRTPRRGQAVIVLDPGLSFGTGQHPTTSFCLEHLAAHRQPEIAQSFLDIGTGSGILAISAAKLGYSPVHAFDSDPDSVRIARTNAAQNEVQRQVRIVRQDLASLPPRAETQYDLVCANLTCDLLLAQTRRILSRLRTDGVLVAAGMLKTQFTELRRAYQAEGFKLVETAAEKEWQSGAFTRG